MSRSRATGAGLLLSLLLLAVCAPVVTPHDPLRRFPDFENAPPLKLVDRLERRFAPAGSEVPI